MKNVAIGRGMPSPNRTPAVSPKNDSLDFPVEGASFGSSSGTTNEPRITTALLLAAGTGSRLQPLTKAAPKCLTEVNGVSILERLISNLKRQGFKRLVVGIGHLGAQIQDFLSQYEGDLQIDYVFNPDYATTNNLYSLWLARQQITESFLLVESDLIFDFELLDEMLIPDKMAVSEMLPWMNGTTVELGSCNEVTAFRAGGYSAAASQQFKTVNIYSLSYLSWKKVEERMSRHVLAGELGEYYEIVFAEMIADGTLSFEAVFFDNSLWYEIDTELDLIEAEILFSQNQNRRGERLLARTEYEADSRAILN